ncbi:DUF4350 domain-containing protein [Agromyces sp. ISL-38]|uniref:DUF4350 domain-containing protein n=1 Tax=Agromyces sp. ISL-38 TaxID=2819107 RepID=UPI001BE9C3D1|nr:DUF4350 domain-containing protein [Agromyces sp. ISL-38]MBT2500273.1 DUF4350 domain-containing protein [Agromyces sp. ISL-38]
MSGGPPTTAVPDRAGSARAPTEQAADAATAVTPTFRALVRRRRIWIVFAAVLVLGAIVALAIQGGLRPPGVPLGADNPAPLGSMALVEVLRDHGVSVTESRSLESAVDAAERGATVVLYDEFALLDESRLDRIAGVAERLVVVEPGFSALEALAPGVRLAGVASGPIDDVACELPAAERAGSLGDGQRLLTVDDDARAAGWQGCFRDEEFGFALVSGEGDDGGKVTLVAATTVFANESIDDAGNAALAIGLTGGSDELVWYLPGLGDVDAAEAPSIAELTPGWVSPVMVLLIAVVVAAGIWRGRRFGPLVTENLPVHVPAGETSEGRARLYARSAARGRALDQLRIGAIGGIAEALKLPRAAELGAVTDAAARATGRDEASVRRLLVDTEPGDDHDLIELAAELDVLEREVRATLRPRFTRPADPADPTDPAGRRP